MKRAAPSPSLRPPAVYHAANRGYTCLTRHKNIHILILNIKGWVVWVQRCSNRTEHVSPAQCDKLPGCASSSSSSFYQAQTEHCRHQVLNLRTSLRKSLFYFISFFLNNYISRSDLENCLKVVILFF